MHQPSLPLTHQTSTPGVYPRNFNLKNNSGGAHYRLHRLNEEIVTRREAIFRYLQLYQEKNAINGSRAIANYVAFAVSDYNSLVHNIFSPYTTPAEHLFQWEEIQHYLHQVAYQIEPQLPRSPDSPTDMQLLRYIQAS